MKTLDSSFRLELLTPAERLVAVHVLQGLSNKEISTVLGKAEATVKHQISVVLRSAKVPSRARFIALYYQHFLVTHLDMQASGLPESEMHTRLLAEMRIYADVRSNADLCSAR